MATVSEVTTLPAEMDAIIDVRDHHQEKRSDVEKSGTDEENSKSGEDALSLGQYTEEQYKGLKKKIDRYLLPLMWLCYGIRTSIGTQATFGLEEDTHLVGNQYAWLTTIFYISYMCFEFPSNIILQRHRMGRTLSFYMLCWGIVVLCIGFAQNFAQLIALRALQGMFECCISPGFILVVGSWYTTREHASRTLVFQSANAGFGIISSLTLYGIGSVQAQRGAGFQAWRYMSYFLGSLTIITGSLCLFLLGTPSEVRWLSAEERKMANTRILTNNTGHDQTGVKRWRWDQALECLIDPCFWFCGINAFLVSVPNGGLSTFGSIISTSFGFTNLQVILLNIPMNVFSVSYFALVGILTSRRKNLRFYFMTFSTIPPFIGFLMMSLLPNEPQYKWTKWGGYFMTVPLVISMFLAWTVIPSNTAGRTKRTLTSSFTFVGYCVGNMTGSQIFKSADAPRYVPGTVGCAVCFGLEFLLFIAWRLVYVFRNRRRQRAWAREGISEELRVARAKELGEQDTTDFRNPYFLYTM
ncbi:MFS general substrate transporter [Cryphonectria parasitica EP155]|uniref:MFS general substrate transporter n=1 Tax=Cryphonectria parasitica (strain ATCC 38755 / EP155) TaxID=660469 RepID=A0A9P4Y342_CRYP1|nr:MFS general substrate transporter [Cryphonectria parasitica EP155]KAF3765793.1 MFS general substrate transporter [Cryphonectria parasitica EP155]